MNPQPIIELLWLKWSFHSCFQPTEETLDKDIIENTTIILTMTHVRNSAIMRPSNIHVIYDDVCASVLVISSSYFYFGTVSYWF